MLFTEVNPESFIDPVEKLPATGRGAWSSRGIEFSNRYQLSPKGVARLGTECEKSLDHWAVGAAINAIRARLVYLGLTDKAADRNTGRFGSDMNEGVRAFQAANFDPMTEKPLWVDGIVGMSDSRALWTPVIDRSEEKYQIPKHLLRGLLNHESLLDTGAVGYYIYYINYDGTTRYGGVDRGLEQNNSKANTSVDWRTAFDADWSIDDGGRRLRVQYDKLYADYPNQTSDVLWDAAIVSHNSPANGRSWARLGAPPTTQAAAYVASVYNSVY